MMTRPTMNALRSSVSRRSLLRSGIGIALAPVVGSLLAACRSTPVAPTAAPAQPTPGPASTTAASKPSPVPATAVPAATAAPTTGKKKISVFDWNAFGTINMPTGKPKDAAGAKMVAEYQKQTGTEIDLVEAPRPFLTWEKAQGAAGTLPDLVSPEYTMQVFEELPNKWWLDLTDYRKDHNPYTEGKPVWTDMINLTMDHLNAFVGGKYYVFSWDAQDFQIFYNKDIFTKAGLDPEKPPTTWADFIAAQAQIKQKVPDVAPFEMAMTGFAPVAHQSLVWNYFEGQLMATNLAKMDANGDGTVDIGELLQGIDNGLYRPTNSDFKEAYKVLKDWSQFWEKNFLGVKDEYAPFVQGQAAMFYDGPYQITPLDNDKSRKFAYGSFALPQITPASSSFATSDKKGIGVNGVWNAWAWSIPTTAAKRGTVDIAVDFFFWFASPQWSGPINDFLGNIPVTKGTQVKPALNLQVDILNNPVIHSAAVAALGTEFLQARIAAVQGYLGGIKSADELATDLESALTKARQQAKTVYGI